VSLRQCRTALFVVFFLLSGMLPAAEFSLPDLNGVTHHLTDYRGKWVVVNYWATWCPPCLKEIPELVDFYKQHKNSDTVVLGINMEDISLDRLKAFVKHYFISYPVLRMELTPMTVLGPVPALPTTYVVSPTGEVVARHVGPVSTQILESFITQKSSAQKLF
jgi:Peroxiredoxin